MKSILCGDICYYCDAIVLHFRAFFEDNLFNGEKAYQLHTSAVQYESGKYSIVSALCYLSQIRKIEVLAREWFLCHLSLC